MRGINQEIRSKIKRTRARQHAGAGRTRRHTLLEVEALEARVVPTIITIGTSKDNTLFESATGDLSNGAGPGFFVGQTNGGVNRRGVIAFDIAGSVPAGATINSVTLRLNLSMSMFLSGPQPIQLRRLLADWGEGTSIGMGTGGGFGGPSTTNDATWIHRFFSTTNWTNPGGDFTTTASASTTVNFLGLYTWGSTPQMVADVQAWLNTPTSNFGWLVLGNETATGTAKRFDTKENSIVESRPMLTIDYTAGAPTTLRVTSFTSSRNGFTATFNQPVAVNDLNLYDTQPASLGPADVTLVGNVTGAVRGSLVSTGGGTTVTFLSTGDVLPADTYTVRLRSATNGFHDMMGALLDGNADGTPGDDYVNTFTISPSLARVVSLPDFARGPGQPIDVPATSQRLPLRINDGANVTSITLRLEFNPNLINVTAASLGAGAPAGATVNLTFPAAGQADITFSSPTALAAGLVEFVTLTARVPDMAPYTSKQVLNITNLSVSGTAGGIASQDDDALHVVTYLGDTNANAAYSAADAQRILRVALGLDSGFVAFQLADPVIIADITGNGELSSTDATRVLQEVVGLDRQEIPPPGTAPPIAPGGPDPFLNIPVSFTAARGDILTVPVLLDRSVGLENADLAISFDPRRLEVVEVRRGSLTGDFDLFTANLGARDGALRVGLGRSAGSIEDRGSGSVIEITFRVRDEAPTGPTILNLRQGLGQLTTQLNEGGLDLIPDPSDEEGDVLDGRITVLDESNKTYPVRVNGPSPQQEKETSLIDVTDAVFAILAKRQRRETIHPRI